MIFRFDEIKKFSGPERVDPSAVISTEEKNVIVSGEATTIIKKISEHVRKNVSIHFTSHGSFSMHQLLQAILTVAGNADVFISTWAMTEDPVRAIDNLKSTGRIRELHLLFDYKINDRSAQAIQLAKNIATSYQYTKCHAKTTVIMNDDWGISIVGSANYTRNPRIERGTIFCYRDIAEFDRAWIVEAINNSIPSTNEME